MSNRNMLAVICVLGLAVSAVPAEAGLITYQFNNQPALQNGFDLSGTLTIDVATPGGSLRASDIDSYLMQITDDTGTIVSTLDSNTAGRLELVFGDVRYSPGAISVYGLVPATPGAATFSGLELSASGNTIDWFAFTGITQYQYVDSTGVPVGWNELAQRPTVGEPVWTVATRATDSTVPEPLTVATLLLGFTGLGVRRWTRRTGAGAHNTRPEIKRAPR